MKIKNKYKKVIEYFQKHLPEPNTELNYNSPYELIVAVILSAQCTDKRVNIITPAFFKEFPDVTVLARSNIKNILKFIKSCTYPNNKAKHLLQMAQMLDEKFKNEVPTEPEILQTLPGIGRKSANVIASVLFNKKVIAVDTHVFRVSKRLGLVTEVNNTAQCEKQLSMGFPLNLLPKAHHWLILHGRYVCLARKPKCEICGIKLLCNYYKKNYNLIIINKSDSIK